MLHKMRISNTCLNKFHQSVHFTIHDLEVVEEIGSGTCGQVCKMKHKNTGDVLAVKVYFGF